MYHEWEEDLVATELREEYISCWRKHYEDRTGHSSSYNSGVRWDGGLDGRGAKHPCVWIKMAAFIRKHNLTPRVFVRAQFHRRPGPEPAPNTFMNDEGVGKYHQFKKIGSEEIKPLLDAQMTAFERAMVLPKQFYKDNIGQALRHVLACHTVYLSSLFRYCVAERAGLSDQVEFWRKPATMQYRDNRQAYDTVWGDLIPSSLREAVLTT